MQKNIQTGCEAFGFSSLSSIVGFSRLAKESQLVLKFQLEFRFALFAFQVRWSLTK